MSNTHELAKQYRPEEVESEIAQRWDSARAFHAEPDASGAPYSIVIPPPNVTAALHMGHALNNTLQDMLIRYHRMCGDNTLWMPGTDHAGIATQTVVEKRVLQEEGKKRTDFQRDEFVARIQKWKDEYEKRITDQLKAMGCSCDWNRQRFTMDEQCAKAVREAFFQLFKDGLIYRGKRLVNWDPVTQTALADDEVEMEEIDGNFYYMQYPLGEPTSVGGRTITHVTVATTRPETMLGDTAVAVNPKDAERAALIGKEVILPIVNRRIPIIGDDYVVIPAPGSGDAKAEYASGFLKVTPAHDPNDYDIGQRHTPEPLPIINVMAPDASISVDHGWTDASEECKPLLGLSREDARKWIVRWFKDHGLMEEIRPYRHAVGHSYRSHAAIEPYLSDQWYVKVTDPKLAGAALQAMNPKQRSAIASETSRDNSKTSRDRQGAVPPTHQQPYLITFTTYGTWLHGDTRGSVDCDHNVPGTPIPIGDEARERQDFARLKHEPFKLNEAQRAAVQDAIIEVCEHRAWPLAALHVRSNHLHAVLAADVAPERVMNDFKSYATRRLRRDQLVDEACHVWTRHGSTRYLWDEPAVDAAIRYVLQQQGAEMSPRPHEGKPLPHGRGSDARGALCGDVGAATVRERSWAGQLTFTPERYAKTFEQWHRNIRDWCISRQLWWGHRIPVWQITHNTPSADQEANLEDNLDKWAKADRIVVHQRGPEGRIGDGVGEYLRHPQWYVCVRDPDDREIIDWLETNGYFQQDPDVLDTWFSSALWPLSTLGWPEDTPELATWNPTNVLCTAREIITLWVSRMVMFNLYFKGQLPFRDVFIHAMIQDGHGQKMSKSLGNGVDPVDIIHSHGSDAMRFTLAQMTTHTQDVRLPVECVAPASGEPFEPKYKTLPNGYKVAQAIQEHKGEKMVSSYGIASGEAVPSKELPGARNTSEKFDYGRNFANKLWNATRFALSKLSANAKVKSEKREVKRALPDRWILSRVAQIVEQTTHSLESYDFHNYADDLYHFIWGDVCDWYIEAIKPTVESDPAQQQVLACVLDVSLRLLHPAMPFITERLFEALNDACPRRSVEGLELPAGELLVKAAWPKVQASLRDEQGEQQFEQVRELVTMIREARTQCGLPPRQTVDVTLKTAAAVDEAKGLIEALANVTLVEVGPDAAKPADAVVAVRAIGEAYLHHAADTEAERQRLEKRLAEVDKSIAAFKGRLANKGYVDKAPAHLVQQTRDELARVEAERQRLAEQLGCL